MGICCIQKDSIISSNSIIKNNSLKESSINDSDMEVCHINKKINKVESLGPILKILMKKQENKQNTEQNTQNISTKITKIFYEI